MKLNAPLTADQIQAMRGTVDFYYWRGVPVVRAWPARPHQPNTPAQLQARARLRFASAYSRTAPKSWVQRWIEQPSIPGRSYRDQLISVLVRTLAYATPQVPPDITGEVLKFSEPVAVQRLSLFISPDVPANRDAWALYARAQPPGDPAISHYDAGWHFRRCRALYKLYRPIWQNFKRIHWEPTSTPEEWIVTLQPPVDALSYCLIPNAPGLTDLEQTDAVIPPRKVQYHP